MARERRWWEIGRMFPFFWKEPTPEETDSGSSSEEDDEEKDPEERELTPTIFRQPAPVPDITFTFLEVEGREEGDRSPEDEEAPGPRERGKSEESELSYSSTKNNEYSDVENIPAKHIQSTPEVNEMEEKENEKNLKEECVVVEQEECILEEMLVEEMEDDGENVPKITLTLGATQENLYEIIDVDPEAVYAAPVEDVAVGTLAPVYTTVMKTLPPPLPPPDWTPTDTPPPKPSWKKRLKHLCKQVATPQPSPVVSTLLLYQGQSGFDDLRRFIKQGGDFCKELAAILHERSEAEAQYAKTLTKLSSKLIKATREGVGTINSGWQKLGVEMEAQGEVHRSFAASLNEDVVKPLRQLVESQHRIRKGIENAVDKSGKSLAEWRNAESKAKKNSFSCARDNEKLRDTVTEPRSRLSASSLQLHRPSPDKEHAKLESKRRKAEECVKKADVEYYSVCTRAERARLEWESAVIRGGHCFQVLEEERLRGLRDLAIAFLSGFNQIGPKLTEIGGRLADPVGNCDVSSDKETVSTLRCQPPQEQNLPDFYAEHFNLAMNADRRKQALVKLLHLIRQDLERERRGKNGVENLARALKQTPNFASEDTQHNVSEKLHHMRSMLAYLEASRYKVASALAEVEGRVRETHPLAEHISITRDRQGLQNSTLKVPSWVHKDSVDMTSDFVDWVERGTADGNSVQPDSDFDEFSSQGSEKEFDMTVVRVGENLPNLPLKCKALYNYQPKLYDELYLNPGDIINIHDKQPDGWWLGELNGVVGIFPATYVEEIK